MTDVATLNIRNVPAEVVDALKAQAVRHGRSLNAEVVSALEGAAQQRSVDEVLQSIERNRANLGPSPHPDYAADLIRQGREGRTEAILQAARGERPDEK